MRPDSTALTASGLESPIQSNLHRSARSHPSRSLINTTWRRLEVSRRCPRRRSPLSPRARLPSRHLSLTRLLSSRGEAESRNSIPCVVMNMYLYNAHVMEPWNGPISLRPHRETSSSRPSENKTRFYIAHAQHFHTLSVPTHFRWSLLAFSVVYTHSFGAFARETHENLPSNLYPRARYLSP